jgi:ribosome assembly protein YihI (activator of Der GTPase)
MARQKMMNEDLAKEQVNQEYEERRARIKSEEEAKLAKNRAKRLKRKGKKPGSANQKSSDKEEAKQNRVKSEGEIDFRDSDDSESEIPRPKRVKTDAQ